MKDFAEWNLVGGRFVGFEPPRNNRIVQNWTSPWQSYMIVGGALTIIMMLHNG